MQMFLGLVPGWLGRAPQGPSMCFGSKVRQVEGHTGHPYRKAATHSGVALGTALLIGRNSWGLGPALVQEGHDILGRELLLLPSDRAPVGEGHGGHAAREAAKGPGSWGGADCVLSVDRLHHSHGRTMVQLALR